MPAWPYYNEDEMQAEVGAPDILGIGDSWFHYPICNLLISLNDALAQRFSILALGKVGANATDYVQSRFKDALAMSVSTYRQKLRAVMISGGGNDFAGLRDFTAIIQPSCRMATSVADCFRAGQPDVLLNQVEQAYRTVIRTIRDNGFAGPVFTHNYDYAIPTGKGFLGFGQWLKAPMALAEVPAPLCEPLVNFMITELGRRLAALNGNLQPIVFLDTAGTLSRAEWANELHPKPKGFEKLVQLKWEPALRQVLP